MEDGEIVAELTNHAEESALVWRELAGHLGRKRELREFHVPSNCRLTPAPSCTADERQYRCT
jgi:hypothetical protein